MLITVLLIKTGTNKFLTAILIELYVIIKNKIKIYKIRIEQLQSMIKKKEGGGGQEGACIWWWWVVMRFIMHKAKWSVQLVVSSSLANEKNNIQITRHVMWQKFTTLEAPQPTNKVIQL